MSVRSRLLPRRARHRVKPLLHTLESRLLMSASVFEYPAPASGNIFGTHITSDLAGNLYTASTSGGILKFDPVTETETFLPLPSSGLIFSDVTFGPDGNLWVTQSFGNPTPSGIEDQFIGEVLKVTTSGIVLNTYSLGTTYGQPYSPTVGADGKIYISSSNPASVDGNGIVSFANDVIAMNTNGTFTTFTVPHTDGMVRNLAAGGDGKIYVAFSGSTFIPNVGDEYTTQSRIGVIDGGVLTMVSLDDPGNIVNPYGRIEDLTLDPEGNLWFPLYSTGPSDPGIDRGANQIIKVSFNSSLNPTFTSFSIPGESPDAPLFPIAIIASTDGSIWVGESQGNFIDRVNTATNTVDRIAIPSGVVGATLGKQVGNAIYFGEAFTGNIARIDLPVVGSGLTVAGLAGQSVSGTVALLTTTLSAAQIAGLSATISWGDSGSSAGTIVNNGNGTFSVNGAHTYASPGDYITNIVITGSGIDAVRVSGEAAIVPGVTFAAAGVPVAPRVENTTFTAAVATFIGPAGSYAATINWGNGVTTAGTIINVSGVYQVVGTINYATQGTRTITVSITGTNSAVVTTSVTISDVPLVVTAARPVVLLGRIAIGTTAFFTDDSDSSFTRYSASINWGDGSTSAGLVLPIGTGQYTVAGLHIYRRGGNYNLTTTVTTISGEDAGATASASIVLNV